MLAILVRKVLLRFFDEGNWQVQLTLQMQQVSQSIKMVIEITLDDKHDLKMRSTS